jgi:glycosyltransferase involved in cell wall biosynthesis
VRLLFVMEELRWPRSSGHDVHSYEMMRALAALGHEVGLALATPPSADAIDGLPLAWLTSLDAGGDPVRLSPTRERFRNYWGVAPARISAVAALARQFRPDAVVVVGLKVLPYLAGVGDATRIWYAADEWIWHHLSQVRVHDRDTWPNVKAAAIKGWYERAFRRVVDRVWVVSDADRHAMRWLAGMPGVDVVPNGVDPARFAPLDVPQRPDTLVFWGRLDFGPNIQALDWIVSHVWDRVRAARPGAEFTIIGYQPCEAVRRLAARPGIVLKPDVEDLRAEVAGQAVVAFPFVSGGGIKNKLLEAAAMAKAVVCTPRALSGVRARNQAPFLVGRTAEEWTGAILGLWNDESRRHEMERAARTWVTTHHSWEHAARDALAGLSGPAFTRLPVVPHTV